MSFACHQTCWEDVNYCMDDDGIIGPTHKAWKHQNCCERCNAAVKMKY